MYPQLQFFIKYQGIKDFQLRNLALDQENIINGKHIAYK